MKRYAVIQHSYSEFLGLIEAQLEARDIGFTYFRPFVDQDLPGTAIHFDALFVLGGAFPLTDERRNPWLAEERRLLARFRQAQRPVVGLGYGGLLVAAEAGANLSDEPFHNAYWTRARKTAAGEGDPLAEAVDGRRVLVMFNGSAQLPEGVEPLLVDEQGRWLAIRPDSLSYGLLFRPELKPGMLEDMIMEDDRPVPDDMGMLLETARMEWADSQQTTDRVVVALVKALELMKERRKAPVFHLNVEKS